MKVLIPLVDRKHSPTMVATEVSGIYPSDSEIHFLYVIDVELIEKSKSYSEYYSPEKIEEVTVEAEQEKAESYLKEIAEELEKRGYKITTEIQVGHYLDEIREKAKTLNADMIAVFPGDFDVLELANSIPILVKTITPREEKVHISRKKELTQAVALMAGAIVFYGFVFTNIDKITKVMTSKSFVAGITLWACVLIAILLYGTAANKFLKCMGLDTKH